VLLAFFVILAVFGPYVAPYPLRRAPAVASNFAMPEWMSIFPDYADLPRTTDLSVWEIKIVQNSSLVNIFRGQNISFCYESEGIEDVSVVLSLKFGYFYKPPENFKFSLRYVARNISRILYNFKLVLTDPNGTEWEIADASNMMNSTYGVVSVLSQTRGLREKLFGDMTVNPARVIFADKGNYSLSLEITFKPLSEHARGVIYLIDGAFTYLGSLHGILGTDSFMRDVFSQLLYGAGMSLLVGILTSIVTTSLAVVFGTISGYFGGLVDEVVMRVVDVIMCLPFFVILLTLSRNYRVDILSLILLISSFWWTGPTRTIRSRILSLKESMFIESAKTAGGTGFYIIRRHLVPNIIPLALSALVLFVPAGILMEAALSFLGFGAPDTVTWGRILSDARATGAFQALAWWYVIPPGLAISFLCLSFVFIGHALDSVVNPRLRRRK